MGIRIAAPQHVDDVAQRRAVERRDDANLAGQGRERPFPRGLEQPFGLEPPLELLEGQLAGTHPVRLQVLADDLVLALRFVDTQPATRDDAEAVLRREAQSARGRSEHHAFQLSAGILEREVQVAGAPALEIRELPVDPHVAVGRLEQFAHRGGQLGHREDPAVRWSWRRPGLVWGLGAWVVIVKRQIEEIRHGHVVTGRATSASTSSRVTLSGVISVARPD